MTNNQKLAEHAEQYRLAQARTLINWRHKYRKALEKPKSSKEYKEAIRMLNSLYDKNGKVTPTFSS